ncbi:MAG: DUF2357 domain-containing protein [Anaerolineales bacterium]|nr:DUF2357 domain-containing protein [Anaerolineales bacterium]
MDPLQSCFIEKIASLSDPIPPDLCGAFAPASHYLREWKDYWVEYPEAERLRAGTKWFDPVEGVSRNLFRLRFENQIGLTMIQPFAGGHALSPPTYVEIVSSKFPTPAAHLNFFRTLLDDLFARAARLPFTFCGPTGRGVTEALRPPTPLFILHFLCQYAWALQTALTIIQAMPHRWLRDHPAFVPLAEAAEADADVLISILHAAHDWVPAHGFPLAERLQGHAPTHVWQSCFEETLDTPENRFVLYFLRQVLIAAEVLPVQRWWHNVPPRRQAIVRETSSLLRQAIAHPMFADVGPLHHLPLTSQVLLRREGYCNLLALWQRFQQARRPLFAPLQQAMEVRDIATLYEFWVFFALVEEIAVQVQESPVVDLSFSDEAGLRWRAEARFESIGRLVYNWQQRGYSVPLRPDFTWVRARRPEVVLDAKFRLERRDLEGMEENDTLQASARRTDLYKMHTYRDALGVRAAVSVYPGDMSVFYDCTGTRLGDVTLRDVLNGDLAGIGALAMQPSSD